MQVRKQFKELQDQLPKRINLNQKADNGQEHVHRAQNKSQSKEHVAVKKVLRMLSKAVKTLPKRIDEEKLRKIMINKQ